LVESDKIAKKIPNLELAWQDIDILITDENLDELIKEQLIAQGINLICAKST